MDPEPDRCRRTDGRKWRCSKNAVPDQKYCDGHMHRGRRRGSRKRVEPYPSNGISVDSLSFSSQNHPIQCRPGTKHNRAECKESSVENSNNRRKIGGWNDGTVNDIYLGIIPPGFDSSVKSVLHCGAGKVWLGSENITGNTPQRCRRTDGKKWQCSREALPNQKYCPLHMHRGARRVMCDTPSAAKSFQEHSSQKARSSSTLSTSLDNTINLNTIPPSPRHIGEDNSISTSSSSSDSSDATTISD
ncbi:hypothetical protein OROMI_013926 [Orobanche minor]